MLTRRHAAVTVTEDTVTLEDQDSRNGTFRSGERLTGPVSLQIGDVVTFGDQITATVMDSWPTRGSARRASWQVALWLWMGRRSGGRWAVGE